MNEDDGVHESLRWLCIRCELHSQAQARPDMAWRVVAAFCRVELCRGTFIARVTYAFPVARWQLHSPGVKYALRRDIGKAITAITTVVTTSFRKEQDQDHHEDSRVKHRRRSLAVLICQ